jgi:glyoxylase-like metal-dependent hydrolase (beta-lactamase superfamily II)
MASMRAIGGGSGVACTGSAALDRAVISHGDNDHAGGFQAVRANSP